MVNRYLYAPSEMRLRSPRLAGHTSVGVHGELADGLSSQTSTWLAVLNQDKPAGRSCSFPAGFLLTSPVSV
jgi:hypothetical protein